MAYEITPRLDARTGGLRVKPRLDPRFVVQLPSRQFTGSEGGEWIPPEIYPTQAHTDIAFPIRLFGVPAEREEQLVKYSTAVADIIGATLNGIEIIS